MKHSETIFVYCNLTWSQSYRSLSTEINLWHNFQEHEVFDHSLDCCQNCEICLIVSDSLRKRFVKTIADYSDAGTKVFLKASL